MSPSPFYPAVAGTPSPLNITLQPGTDSFLTAAANSLSACSMFLGPCSLPMGISSPFVFPWKLISSWNTSLGHSTSPGLFTWKTEWQSIEPLARVWVPYSLQLSLLASRQRDEGFSALPPVAVFLDTSEMGQPEGFWVLFSTSLPSSSYSLWQAEPKQGSLHPGWQFSQFPCWLCAPEQRPPWSAGPWGHHRGGLVLDPGEMVPPPFNCRVVWS